MSFEEEQGNHSDDWRISGVVLGEFRRFGDVDADISTFTEPAPQFIRRFFRAAVIFQQCLVNVVRSSADKFDFAL